MRGKLPHTVIAVTCLNSCPFQYDHECDQGYVCEYNKCVEKPDPCDPNPCGMMAICTVDRYGEAKCECPRGTFGDGFVGCQQVRTSYSSFHMHRFGDERDATLY